MDPIELKPLLIAIEKQGKLLERIATSAERTNELLYALLSAEQKKALSAAGVASLAAKHKG
jgi:hypothetical protein